MKLVVVGYVLCGLFLVSGVGALWGASGTTRHVDSIAPGPIPEAPRVNSRTTPAGNVRLVLVRNLFNATRTENAQAFNTRPIAPMNRPNFQLVGVIWGDPPIALVRGLGNNPGYTNLMEPGEELGGVRLESLRADTAAFIFESDTLFLTIGHND